MQHRAPTLHALSAIVAVAATACYPEPPRQVVVDEQSVLSAARTARDSTQFVQLNQEPYATALPSRAPINVYVHGEAAREYGAVAPEAAGSGVILPEGAMIVREVLDADGAVQTVTLMVKGPEGYNPDLGDWWFGVTDPGGAVILEDGVPKAGRIEACYSCHLDRADDDFLFGVPAAMRPIAGP